MANIIHLVTSLDKVYGPMDITKVITHDVGFLNEINNSGLMCTAMPDIYHCPAKTAC